MLWRKLREKKTNFNVNIVNILHTTLMILGNTCMRNTEQVVYTRSIIVQTEDTDLIKCKECEHSEKHPSATHRNRHGKREGCG